MTPSNNDHKPRVTRKSTYCPETARQMCEQLSDGIPLRQICRQEGFPAWQTVYDWMWRDPDLAGAIARAREVGQDAIAEDIYRQIEAPPARIEDEQGRSRIDPGYVQWIRVQAEVKLKLLAKWNPKRYGDRVSLAGDAGSPVLVDTHFRVFEELLKSLKTRRQSEG